MPGQRNDILTGERSKKWIEVIGKFGDPVRTAIVNPIVAFVANSFATAPLTPRSLSPVNLVQQALAKVKPDIDTAASTAIDLQSFMNGWHENHSRLLEFYPNLKNSIIWDLGCGNGYLGRWLASQGASYVGVEASQELLAHGRTYPKIQSLQYFEGSITKFLKSKESKRQKPTLITCIGVLDGVADPTAVMRELCAFLRTTSWTDVPILLTTFDPDYFAAGLPQERRLPALVRGRDPSDPLFVVDPADWEFNFSDSGFHVLDQRPIHLNSLAPQLGKYILERWRSKIAPGTAPLDQIPPRQGPFYFWLLAPRVHRPVMENAKKARFPSKLKVPVHVQSAIVSYLDGEPIELQGNLGSSIYELIEGRADFTYAKTLSHPFKAGDLFGQMEMGRNYFASRILGSITAKDNVCVRTFAIPQVAAAAPADHFIRRLFVSMIDHLDSVSFTRLLNSRQITMALDERSEAIPSEPMTSARNCAAALLNACAVTSISSPVGYRARTLVIMSHEDLQNRIYHEAKDRRKSGRLRETIEIFVQRNLVDCFSARLVRKFRDTVLTRGPQNGAKSETVRPNDYQEAGGIQQNIFEIEDDKLASRHYLHLGLIAARYVARAVADIDLKLVAFGISACLGSKTDLEHFNDSISELHMSRVRTLEQRQATVVKCICQGAGTVPDSTREAIEKFLAILCDEFPLSANVGETHYEASLSRFIIVRDVWALLACAIDDDTIWSSDEPCIDVNTYIESPEQEYRLLSYFYECIGHVAKTCGLPI